MNTDLLILYLREGINMGAFAGFVMGAITLTIVANPESLFKSIFGFLLGGALGAAFNWIALSDALGALRDSWGGALPDAIVTSAIQSLNGIVMGGLLGMVAAMLITDTRRCIIGALLGVLLGTFLGVAVYFLIQITGLDLNELFYPPAIGGITLIIFALFGGSGN
ncbi:MAG: hypothetical protein OHK0052_24900 [Anaerolineales bacterium]